MFEKRFRVPDVRSLQRTASEAGRQFKPLYKKARWFKNARSRAQGDSAEKLAQIRKALERVGCGKPGGTAVVYAAFTGELARALAREGFEVHASDASPFFAKKAAQKIGKRGAVTVSAAEAKPEPLETPYAHFTFDDLPVFGDRTSKFMVVLAAIARSRHGLVRVLPHFAETDDVGDLARMYGLKERRVEHGGLSYQRIYGDAESARRARNDLAVIYSLQNANRVKLGELQKLTGLGPGQLLESLERVSRYCIVSTLPPTKVVTVHGEI